MTYPSNNMTPFDIFTDHNDLSETEFLKNSIANHTKYGSTNCNSYSQNYRYITHYIESTDTLQGLSLKYGCKIEAIKKFNRLFSDDNNHLRSRLSILIPMENKTTIQFDSSCSSLHSSQSSLVATPKAEVECNHNTSESSNNHLGESSKSQANRLQTNSKSLSDSPSDTSDQSVADFLIRIDSSIARTKNQVEKLSKRMDDPSFETELNRANSTKFSTPKRSREQNLFVSSTKSIFDDHLPRVSVNNNRKVKSSLRKLEKSQEEIFEL